jgi:hypothetical protein
MYRETNPQDFPEIPETDIQEIEVATPHPGQDEVNTPDQQSNVETVATGNEKVISDTAKIGFKSDK